MISGKLLGLEYFGYAKLLYYVAFFRYCFHLGCIVLCNLLHGGIYLVNVHSGHFLILVYEEENGTAELYQSIRYFLHQQIMITECST